MLVLCGIFFFFFLEIEVGRFKSLSFGRISVKLQLFCFLVLVLLLKYCPILLLIFVFVWLISQFTTFFFKEVIFKLCHQSLKLDFPFSHTMTRCLSKNPLYRPMIYYVWETYFAKHSLYTLLVKVCSLNLIC